MVLGLARPTTAQTLYAEDPVGTVKEETVIPYVARCWRTGETCSGDVLMPGVGERVAVEAVPVRHGGAVVAVVTREASPTTGRRPSLLERTYLETATEITRMIADGTFPFATEALESQEAPRVGDGILRLDGHARITYASPNAISALRRLGVKQSLETKTLAGLGLDDTAVRTSFTMHSPVSEKMEASGTSKCISARPASIYSSER